jgi:dTDP-4-amino-4,6-dideoxygalactose transaminase
MIIPSFKPAVGYKELNTMLISMLFADAASQQTDVFERKFAEYLGVKHVILVPSARWGLYYILQSLNLKAGDEVILPAFSYFAVPAAIVRAGLKPVFVDINYDNLSIDIRKIEENITQRTRVIIPTHLCGFTCGLDQILDVSRRHNITVIEDCAQSLGAQYLDRKVGSWGDAAYFSFSITKNFTMLGGGAVVTSRDDIAEALRRSVKGVACLGRRDLFFELLKGYVMKLATSAVMFPMVYFALRIFYFFDIDIIQRVFHEKEALLGDPPERGQLNNIQTKLGMTQLSGLDKRNESVERNGAKLYDMLKDIKGIGIPFLETGAKNIFSACPVLVKNKKNIKKILLNRGIDVSAGHLRDCSRLDVFKEFNRYCPNASRAEEEVIYLPLYPELILDKQNYIAGVMQEVFKNDLLWE